MSVVRIDIREFRERGYLQEVNRRFLHPLGLALETVIEEGGAERLGGVWDYRGDPEGIYFDTDTLDLAAAAEHVDDEWRRRAPGRRRALGYVVQPVGAEMAELLLRLDDVAGFAVESEFIDVRADVARLRDLLG